MPTDQFIIQELLGANRNAAEGATEQNPTDLFNLVPTRQGGWQSRGVERISNTGLDYPKNTGDPENPTSADQAGGVLIGYDHQGVSSFIYRRVNSIGGIEYFIRLISQADTNMGFLDGDIKTSPNLVAKASHIPGVGAYAETLSTNINTDPTAFAVLAKDVGSWYFGKGGTSHRASVTSSATGSADLPGGSYRVLFVPYIITRTGKLVTDYSMYYISVPSGGTITVAQGNTGEHVGGEVYLARDPLNGSFSSSWGAISRPLEYVLQGVVDSTARTLNLNQVQFGPTLNVGAYGFPLVVQPKDTALSKRWAANPSGWHNGRVYFNPPRSSFRYAFTWVNSTGSLFYSSGHQWRQAIDRYTAFTVAWTEAGYLNLMNPVKNYYELPAANSSQITAFVSIQDGMIVFCDNECFLMKGDPALAEQGQWEDFNFLPYLPIGCDIGVFPGRLGPDTFTIWNGEVYQVAGGQFQNISKPVYNRSDSFVQVVGDVDQACIVCRAKSGQVFAYYPEEGFWTRIFNSNSALLLPSPKRLYSIPTDRSGLSYLERPEESNIARTGGRASYRLTMGDKTRRKMLKRIRVPISWQTATSFSATLDVKVDGKEVLNSLLVGTRFGDEMLFSLPIGVVAYQFELDFHFNLMDKDTTIEGPIVCEFAWRGQKR